MRSGRLLHTIVLLSCIAVKTEAQCLEQYSWAKWTNFNGNGAHGTIIIDKDTTHVTMTTNYVFGYPGREITKKPAGLSKLPGNKIPDHTLFDG